MCSETDLSEPPIVGILRTELALANGRLLSLENTVRTLQSRLAFQRKKEAALRDVIFLMEEAR